jgi:hypothetical protein
VWHCSVAFTSPSGVDIVPGGGRVCGNLGPRRADVGGGRLVATVIDPDGNVLGLLQDFR